MYLQCVRTMWDIGCSSLCSTARYTNLSKINIFILFLHFAPRGTTNNLTFLKTQNWPTLLPMSFDLLQILGHGISAPGSNDFAKQMLWTACTTSFFASCRMCEILPPWREIPPLGQPCWGIMLSLQMIGKFLCLCHTANLPGLKGSALTYPPLARAGCDPLLLS